ncbi:hypothetical protein BGW38_003720 [Lunasporangiospora selenospora]|uniref:Uncharacterized protein n=1 Tax=Lunasporangiospora selenospora TaxID=979761 RepID=A0A9P6KHQ3_9FUNG|nr:hypothetical protein BGW38_003720 [Lunasporangiospora selenospora]
MSHHFMSSEKEERDRLKREERLKKKRAQATASTTSGPLDSAGDYLDGFEDSLGVFGDSRVANGEAGQIFEYYSHQHSLSNSQDKVESRNDVPLLRLHLANVGGGAVNLMSHFVWNAALVMGEYIEAGTLVNVAGKRGNNHGGGAQFVCLTDYPDPAIVSNLERNWYENLVETPEHWQSRINNNNTESISTQEYQQTLVNRHSIEQRVRCAVRGHAWGESVQEMMELESGAEESGYDWVLLADTLWVSEGHKALLKSCLAVLNKAPCIDDTLVRIGNEIKHDDGKKEYPSQGRILVCCGLHTGYGAVQRFLALARSPEFGLGTRLVEIKRARQWGDERTEAEIRAENAALTEEDLEGFSVGDRNRTVLVYELWAWIASRE